MTEPQTGSVLLPVGRAAGPCFDDAGAPTYRVFLGGRLHSLSESEHLVWQFAHGVPAHTGLWKPSDTIKASDDEGIRDAEAVIDRLTTSKLLHEVRLASEDARNFAVAYRPVPLVLGMAAQIDGTERLAVAIRDRILTEIDSHAYQVFIWAALHENLWSICEVLCQWPLRTARGRPAEMPAGGHGNCPLMANRSAHQGVGGVGHEVVVG